MISYCGTVCLRDELLDKIRSPQINEFSRGGGYGIGQPRILAHFTYITLLLYTKRENPASVARVAIEKQLSVREGALVLPECEDAPRC